MNEPVMPTIRESKSSEANYIIDIPLESTLEDIFNAADRFTKAKINNYPARIMIAPGLFSRDEDQIVIQTNILKDLGSEISTESFDNIKNKINEDLKNRKDIFLLFEVTDIDAHGTFLDIHTRTTFFKPFFSQITWGDYTNLYTQFLDICISEKYFGESLPEGSSWKKRIVFDDYNEPITNVTQFIEIGDNAELNEFGHLSVYLEDVYGSNYQSVNICENIIFVTPPDLREFIDKIQKVTDKIMKKYAQRDQFGHLFETGMRVSPGDTDVYDHLVVSRVVLSALLDPSLGITWGDMMRILAGITSDIQSELKLSIQAVDDTIPHISADGLTYHLGICNGYDIIWNGEENGGKAAVISHNEEEENVVLGTISLEDLVEFFRNNKKRVMLSSENEEVILARYDGHIQLHRNEYTAGIWEEEYTHQFADMCYGPAS